MTDHSALKLDCRWYRFDDAPAGSYGCLHSPDGEDQSVTVSWMPAARGQIPAHARVGYVCPIPELQAARKILDAAA